MKTGLIAIVMFGVALLVTSLFTELIVSDQIVWAHQTHYDSRILLSLSESLTTLNVSKKGSILQVMVTANSTLMIDVLHKGKVEYEWEDIEFQKNVLLLNSGTWAVRIRNNSAKTSCNFTSMITLKESHIEVRKPYLWLRVPLLISGALSISFTVPIYFLGRFRSRLSKESIEIFMAGVIIFALIFSYQIAGFMLQTRTPWVICEGVSMEPTVNFGDLVIIKGTEPQNLAPDDIILFEKITLVLGEEDFSTLPVPTLHRILYMNRVGNHSYFKTKGDNSETPDEWYVPEEGILGKAALILPKLGYIVLMLSRIEVKLLLIGAIVMIFFVWAQIRPKKRKSALP